MRTLCLIACLAVASIASAQELIVHEWGSLTSAQSAKGEALPGLRADLRELPPFVLRWSKVPMDARFLVQEKPILYVYASKAMRLSVRVDSPKGIWTEWWPPAQDFGPRISKQHKFKAAPTKGYVHWQKVDVQPTGMAPAKAPREAQGWYRRLREVDASWLRVRGMHFSRGSSSPGSFDEMERFLLYRGVAPKADPARLQVKWDEGSRTLTLHNRGKERLPRVLVLRTGTRDGWSAVVDAPEPGESTTIAAMNRVALAAHAEHCRTAIELELRRAGLYHKEARGMAAIWSPRWFEAFGLRVLFFEPREHVDALMPLAIAPKPKRTVRVIVHDIEVLTAARKRRVLEWISKLDARTWRDRQAAMAALAQLGRLAEPMLKAGLLSASDAEQCARIKALLRMLDPTVRER